MTKFEDLPPAETTFLAGMISARGKFYIGRGQRGKSVRFSPMFTLELSDLPPHFVIDVLGEPYDRKYFSSSVYRFVLQDEASISDLVRRMSPELSEPLRKRAERMLDFCQAQTQAQRQSAYEIFISQPSGDK